MKIPAEINKGNFAKNSSCLATINIKVKLDALSTKRKDYFIQIYANWIQISNQSTSKCESSP